VAGRATETGRFEAPTKDKTGGFDGERALRAGGEAVELRGASGRVRMPDKAAGIYGIGIEIDGCTVRRIPFRRNDGGTLDDKNFVRFRGRKTGIILLGKHYDTKRWREFCRRLTKRGVTGGCWKLRICFARRSSRGSMRCGLRFDGEEGG